MTIVSHSLSIFTLNVNGLSYAIKYRVAEWIKKIRAMEFRAPVVQQKQNESHWEPRGCGFDPWPRSLG